MIINKFSQSENIDKPSFSSVYYMKIPSKFNVKSEKDLFRKMFVIKEHPELKFKYGDKEIIDCEVDFNNELYKMMHTFKNLVHAIDNQAQKTIGFVKQGKETVLAYFTGEDFVKFKNNPDSAPVLLQEKGKMCDIKTEGFIAKNQKPHINFDTDNEFDEFATQVAEEQTNSRAIWDYKRLSEFDYSMLETRTKRKY